MFTSHALFVNHLHKIIIITLIIHIWAHENNRFNDWVSTKSMKYSIVTKTM